MPIKVAVESNLTPVEKLLNEKGYEVEKVRSITNLQQADKYDAIVVTGLDTNMLGIQDTSCRAVVIDAEGLTPEQVYDEIREHFQ